MPATNEGVALFFKGGLVSTTAYLAFFVGNTEVSGGAYARKAAAVGLWTIDDNKLYLTANLSFTTPTADWGAVDRIKLMSALTGGDVLADWDGSEFSLVDGDGDAVTDIESGNSVFVQGGSTNGLSITVPLS